MPDPSLGELRQIKRILAAILVCLILILVLLVPQFIGLAIMFIAVVGLLSFLWSMRLVVQSLWYEIWSLW